MFRTKAIEKIKTHILYAVIVFRKSCHLWECEEYGTARQTTDYSIMLGRKDVVCMTDNQGKTHTHTHSVILNTYCFSMATVVTRTPLGFALYVHYLSCFRNYFNCCHNENLKQVNWKYGHCKCVENSFVLTFYWWWCSFRVLLNQACLRQTVPELTEFMAIV